MKLRVRNVLGIAHADIELAGITLVAGHNAAGKTSLLQAAACALLSTPAVRGLSTRKAAAAALREGAEAGSVALEYDGGTVRVRYPEAAVEQSGRLRFLGTPLGVGSAHFSRLSTEDRLRQVVERMGAAPTADDLTQWFRGHPAAGLDEKALSAIWDELDDQGWDAVAARAKEHSTKLKGRWEQVTHLRWGDKVRKGWCPDQLDRAEQYDVEDIERRIGAAAADLQRLQASVAISAERKASLERSADAIPGLEEADRKALGEHDALTKQQEAALGRLEALRDAAALPLTCPHCQQAVRLVRSDKGATFLEQAKALTTSARQRTERELEEERANVDRLSTTLQGVAAQRVRIAADLVNGRRARDELLRLTQQPTIDPQEVDRARDRKLEQERLRDAVKARDTARDISAEYDRHQLLVAALAPDGVRKTVLQRKLSDLNSLLSEFSAGAKFPEEVQLGEDLSVGYGKRPYQLLSESEQWRCDFVIGAVLAQREGAPVILVDRLDLLHPQARPGVLFLLHRIGIPALICMTAKAPDTVPDLRKARMGTVLWLDQGELKEVA